jgi:hypothetical protein
MSKLETMKGILGTFWSMVKEDWADLDHKFLRIVVGAISFALVAVFWFYFFRHIAFWPF